MQKSASTLTDVLTPIWERVLQRPEIGPEDNFFDLGGDSLLAVQLFSEIERACGREMAPVTIYCAPTITSLAAALENPAGLRFPPLVQLKPGTNEPPIFLAHGLAGTAMDFFQLVKYIETSRFIYGMQARGTDGVDEPFDRIEDLAQYHLEAIRELQPHGPYFLVGYSLGGLVTLEMAQRLTALGEEVALLAMIETYPHPRFLSLGQRLRLATRLATQRATTLGRLPIRDALSYIVRPSERRLYSSRENNGNASTHVPAGAPHTPTMQRAREYAYRSLTRYRPNPYSGAVKFVRAEIVTEFPDDPAAIWSSLIREFHVETVPGDHLGVLGTHFESLGSVLSRYLRDTSSHR
ncbi:MAG TPA: alpha/beta fold hydrolase [Candidatus Limnocylindrales bacterium]|nr:alpha/beta fold hydrolase [Candidatus Limnocylindrales bacterium]